MLASVLINMLATTFYIFTSSSGCILTSVTSLLYIKSHDYKLKTLNVIVSKHASNAILSAGQK